MSDLNVIEGFEPPPQFSSITDIEFSGIASSVNGAYSFFPVLISKTEDLTLQTTPAYVGVYITENYENTCTGDCNISGWYTFKRDSAIDPNGNLRYSESIAWPSGTENDTGKLSINETDVPDTARFYCVFLDTDNGAVGSGGTDNWTSPVNEDSTPITGDYVFTIQSGGENNFANYTLENVGGGNAGYLAVCEIKDFSGMTQLQFDFDPPREDEQPPDSINDPQALFDSLVVNLSTVMWDINENELLYVGTVDPSDTEAVNVFGISVNDPNILIFNFESGTVPSKPESAVMGITIGESVLTVGKTGQFSTIQSAIDFAMDGFTILVSDDSSPYREAINFKNKFITLRGNKSNPENCIISGIKENGAPVEAPEWSRPSFSPSLVSVVTVDTREPGTCYGMLPDDGGRREPPSELIADAGTPDFTDRIIEGFTIRDGTAGTRYPSTEPGCISCSQIPPCLGPESARDCGLNCSPPAQKEGYVGGGVWVYRSYLQMIDCIIEDNSSDGGGGVFARESLVGFTRCKFANNISKSNGGGLQLNHCGYSVSNCEFTSNSATGEGMEGTGIGGAIHVFAGVGNISDSTMNSNISSLTGAGMNLTIRWTQAFGDDVVLGGAGGLMQHSMVNCAIENNVSSSGGCGGLALGVSDNKSSGSADGVFVCAATTICDNISMVDDVSTISNLCQQEDPFPNEFLDGGGNSICDGIPQVDIIIAPNNFVAGADTLESIVTVTDGEADDIKYKWYIKYRDDI